MKKIIIYVLHTLKISTWLTMATVMLFTGGCKDGSGCQGHCGRNQEAKAHRLGFNELNTPSHAREGSRIKIRGYAREHEGRWALYSAPMCESGCMGHDIKGGCLPLQATSACHLLDQPKNQPVTVSGILRRAHTAQEGSHQNVFFELEDPSVVDEDESVLFSWLVAASIVAGIVLVSAIIGRRRR